MKLIFAGLLVACFLAGCLGAHTIGAKTSKLKPAQTEYKCWKTDEPITVDGKLNEDVWRRTPSVEFYGITDHLRPPFLTEGKMRWDDNHLYLGFYFEHPDVRCYWTFRDSQLTDPDREALLTKKSGPWAHPQCRIMTLDSFVEVFLDPDGDGSNYLEFHVSPANNVFEAWYKQGFTEDKWANRDRFPDVDWTCPGLLCATFVDGTLNAAHDVDKGWSVEMAIPWPALEPFTQGACPPRAGDLWGAHLVRIYRDRDGGSSQYWVWPFLEIRNCHLPDRYAKLVFEDNP